MNSLTKDANLFGTPNGEAGAWQQHRNEKGYSAARLPTKCWRSMEQKLPATEPIQRRLHLDKHATRSLPEPEADPRELEPTAVSRKISRAKLYTPPRLLSHSPSLKPNKSARDKESKTQFAN